MTSGALGISVDLARQLIDSQFPQWADLPIREVDLSGWDNRSFRLGRHLVMRLPSAEAYAAQVEREQRWLPVLARALPQPIPIPVAMGEPTFGYPWKWSVYRWIEGKAATPEQIDSLPLFAKELAIFLRSLHAISSEGGPVPGPDNFHRGGALSVYDLETRQAISVLTAQLDAKAVTKVWDAALASQWSRAPVWVHGDMSVGNLLAGDGKLCGVIDFGQLCVGDPACDLVPAWTLFDAESRKVFRQAVSLDESTWARGRGWAVWKALIIAAKLGETNAWEGVHCWRTIDNVLADHALAKY
jgi:aminoglycoside phosphotransferase (APT) family kinase protein